MNPRFARLLTLNAVTVSGLVSMLHFWQLAFGEGVNVGWSIERATQHPMGWLQATFAAAVWCWSVTAGIATIEGRSRPLFRAWQALPVALAALMCACVSVLAVSGLWIVAGPVLAIAAAVAAMPVLARLALVPAAAVLEEKRGAQAFLRAWQLAKGNTFRLALMIGLGVVVPAYLAGWAFGLLREGSEGEAWLAVNFAQDLALVAVATLQAIVLASTHLGLAGTPSEEPAEPALSRTWLAVVPVITAVPTVLLLTPAALPGPQSVITHDFSYGTVLDVAWPLGRHPVVITSSAIYDCLDDTCAATDVTAFSGFVNQHPSHLAVTAQGDVYALMYHQIEHCDTRRVCRRNEEGLPFLAGVNAAAITISTYGEIMVARATLVTDPAHPATKLTELSLVRCRDVMCKQPRVTVLGRVPAPEGSTHPSGHEALTVASGRFDRPIVAWRPGPGPTSVHFGWCDTIECATPGVATGSPESLDAQELAALTPPESCEIGSCASLGWAGLANGRGYKAVAEHFSEDGAQRQWLVLLDCPDAECANPARRFQVGELTGTHLPLALATSVDGRVVTFAQHKIIIVNP